ncbi:DUF3426 domain-containing protein [Pseudomonas petrae]|uniref:DUF3426 domain-containing protein n=1 Tax=Pseudomonas petrae TaxID=2912190 RepID=A0ABS9I4A2_9PSED|nr:DUF3426 domain-containing protein [Pseudomonas petrae]MCF7537461.1 DUF3426 domain-containing protein [Pseudomonas petrae]MCF7542618.1 DUF3426 domain-containing protein [Pseudomonas petrae]MCF7556782.1 DUF3426 domain-containing protein [Pseudomonas petrae]
MTDSFVTQCPHCQTSFRVSHAQLSVARGMVRCGSCLQVFNAAKQLLEQRGGTTPETPSPSAPNAENVEKKPEILAPQSLVVTQPAPLPVKREERDVDLDSLDLDDLDVELARLEQREIQLPESFGRVSKARDHDEVESFSARRDEPDVAQESWAHGMSHDDVDRLPELRAEVVEEREEHTDHSIDEGPLEEPINQRDRHRTEPSFSLTPDDLDDEPARPHSLKPQAEADDQPSSERFSALDTHNDQDRLSARQDEDDDEPPRASADGKRGGRNEPGLRDRALVDLTDDPLQLSWQKPKPRWGRRLLWMLLILIALGALAGQYIAYHFEELARQDQYRPVFMELCPTLGCKVPSKVDIKLLKSSNLVVRSHPEFQGALVVDAIIYNRASFSQPFPLLELRFADATGQLIASRRFKPGEYLSGELAGKDEMPPQTPIHIALDILDPGPKAANYSLSFRSPE